MIIIIVGWTDHKVMGAYGRDELNENGERLLLHATDNKLALQHLLCHTMSHPLTVYRTHFKAQTEKRPRTGLITSRHCNMRRPVRNITGADLTQGER